MEQETERLAELQEWGVDLAPIHLALSWTPHHRLEIMEGIIQLGQSVRQQTQPDHVPVLHFASPLPLLAALAPLRVILVGRLAGILQGVPGVSYTLDVCYARDADNVAELVRALAPFTPPAVLSSDRLLQEPALVLDTSLVTIRLYATLPNIGPYPDALAATTPLDIGGVTLRVLTLPALLTCLTAAPDADDVFFVPLVEATALLQRAA